MMEGFIASIFSGISQVVGKVLGHPLDFLAGKSCGTKCQPTWDLFCYLENFCISNLLKLGMIIVLLYFVLLFFYLSYKLGICQCICRAFCASIWACFATCFSTLECCCTFFCFKLQKHNQKRRRRRARDIEELANSIDEEDHEGRISSQARRNFEINGRRRPRSHRGRKYKEEQLRRALRPRNHRLLLRLNSGDLFDLKKKRLIEHGGYLIDPVDYIRLLRCSKLAEKGGSFKASSNHRRR